MAERILKSLNTDIQTFVTFENKTNRQVNLFWLGYDGKPVRYGIIPPKHCTSIDTYVTHPWIARDVSTNYLLLINGETIFYPQSTRDGRVITFLERDRPHIHVPVFSLVQRSMEAIYQVYRRDIIEKFDIPRTLKESILRMSPLGNVTNYPQLGLVSYDPIEEEVAHDHHGPEEEVLGNVNAEGAADNVENAVLGMNNVQLGQGGDNEGGGQ